jgi:uncharacterized protein (DUF1499 family)
VDISRPVKAFARLKGVINSDPSLELVEIDEKEKYLKVKTEHLAVVDYIEFLVKDDDQVVAFQSAEKNSNTAGISDFGVIRKRLEELRKKVEVFSIMSWVKDSRPILLMVEHLERRMGLEVS